ncbi:MAG: EpsG family protein [Eubacteriales bacterium]|nr:EpsG family protein [Eubacteriales bacterium]
MLGFTALQTFLIFIALFAVIYWITPKKLSWLPFVLITIAFAWIGFNVVPDPADDLSRYFKALNEMRDGGYDTLQRYINENQFDFKTFRVAAYYVYFISKLPTNQWLPCITMFIVYGLGFYCIYKASKRFGISKTNTFLGAMFFICTYWYYDTCSGTRNGLAFAIAFACSYQLLVERKYKLLCYAGFVIASLTHSGGIIPVVLVILAEITFNTSGKFLNFLLVFGIIGGAAGIRWLASISDNSFIQGIAGKVDGREAAAIDFSSTGTMFRVNMVVLVVVIALILYFSYFILNCDYTSELKRFYKYSSIVAYFCVGALFSGLIFVRFVRWILPLVGGMIYMIGMQMENNYIDEKGISYCKYYSPSTVAIRVRFKPIVTFAFIAFMAVHLWYMCNGSSLIWMHFDFEWSYL